MSAKHEKIEALFNEALKLKPDERMAFLAETCGTDAELRRQLHELLQAESEAGEFLPDAPKAGATVVAVMPVTEQPGDQIGRYKLLEKLGEGGFGVVYMAEQREPVKRRVALKIIKVGMDTREVVARFEAERQALALMDHPNIAKILDGGVTGGPLTRSAGLQPAVSPTCSRPGVERSDGVEDLQGAGQTADPQVGKPAIQQTASLRYAAGRPYFVMELVRGIRITDYCDQNHLGLEERLKLFMQVCHAVQHAHQKGIIHRDLKPSNILVTLHDGVPVPKVIDFGIAKATQQELTEKTLFTQFHQFIGTPSYMSPEQAELSGLDIDTRSDIYSLGVLLYELLAGKPPFDGQELLKAGLDEMRRTLREVEPIKPSKVVERESELRVKRARARGIPDSTLNSQLKSLSTDLDWIVMKCLEKDRTRRYETANGLAADIQRHLSNEPVVARPPSAAYRFQKMVKRNKLALAATAAVASAVLLGLAVSTWLVFQERAARDRAEKAETRAVNEAAIATAVSQFLREDMLRMTGSYEQADRNLLPNLGLTLKEALDRAALAITNRFTNQPLVEAAVRAALGTTYDDLGSRIAAAPHLKRAFDLRRTHLGEKHPDTIDSMLDLVGIYSDPDSGSIKGLELVKRAVVLTQAYHDSDRALRARRMLGENYRRLRRFTEAIPVFEELLKLTETKHGHNDRETASVMWHLAFTYSQLGQYEKANVMGEEAVRILRATPGTNHPSTAMAVARLGSQYLDQRQWPEAAAYLEEALKLSTTTLGRTHAETVNCVYCLAYVYAEMGRDNDAEALYREAEEIARQEKDVKPYHFANYRANFAAFLARKGRHAEAEPVLREALEVARKSNISSTLDFCLRTFAESLDRQDRHGEAEPLWRELVQLREKLQRIRGSDVLSARASLARCLADWAWTERTNSATASAAKTSPASSAPAGKAQSEIPPAMAATRPVDRAREAERLLRGCLAEREVDPNTSRWRLADARSRLGGAVLVVAVVDAGLNEKGRQETLKEAEKLMLESHEPLHQSTSAAPKYKHDALERLVRLYETWDKPDPATEWRRKLETFDRAHSSQKADTAGEAPR